MKNISVFLNSKFHIGLLDTGASRSCVTKNSSALTNVILKPYQSKLLSADGKLINSAYSVVLTVNIGSRTFDHEFIVVENLSSDVILGVDIIEDLELRSKSNHVILNGESLPLYFPDNSLDGKLLSTVNLKANTNSFVEIKNPFAKNTNISHVFVENIPHSSKNRFVLNSSVHVNSDILNVCLTTSSKMKGTLRKNQRVCKIEPIHFEDSVNGIKYVKSDEEDANAFEFQKLRLSKYGIPTEIQVGSIGHQLSLAEKKELNDLMNKYHLSFSRNSNDIGKLSFYRYTLPILDEYDAAYRPPRPVPPAILVQDILVLEKSTYVPTNWNFSVTFKLLLNTSLIETY